MSAPNQPVSRRRFLRRTLQAAVGGPTLLGLYAWRVEPHWVEVVHRELPIARLPAPLIGKTLAHISDIHVGSTDDAYMRSALRSVLRAEPVAIAMTGDWMTCEYHEQIDKTIDVVNELQPNRTPVIGVLGNHDYGWWTQQSEVAAELTDRLRQSGVQVLRNECLDFRGLQIAGTDDWWSDHCRVKQTVQQLDGQRASLMLAHNPDTVDQPGWEGFNGWVLSGHTHGGQCWAPGIGAPRLPVKNKRYAAGEVQLAGNRRLYVNRGLGYKHRVRFMVRPEITLFRLTRDDRTDKHPA